MGRSEGFSRYPRLVTLTDFQRWNVSVFRAYDPATEVCQGMLPATLLPTPPSAVLQACAASYRKEVILFEEISRFLKLTASPREGFLLDAELEVRFELTGTFVSRLQGACNRPAMRLQHIK